ncbi:MFS transporter [Streptomyces sp. ICN988]|uniref:MFS transporter n=1 Tax=Streptomyces sp. ICN988 TaxID=2983765 RepID=UPI0021E429F4|nr:MFS transporter [Streptomyces sp. ICN988]MCV2458212.1 MFS transporter [Streptomyces sp. ICN988]
MCVTTFMLLLDVTVVNVGLPSVRDALNASFAEQQWVIAAYTLTMAAFLLSSGSLADRLGRKRVFTLGLVIFTLTSLAAGLAVNPFMLNVARGVQGIGAAMLFSVGLALIGQEFRGARARGTAFGLWGAVGGLAFAFGPLIGGSLTTALSWRWIFLVNVPIGLLALLPTVLRLRESRDPHAQGVDRAGMVTFGAGLALLLFGLMAGNSEGWNCPPVLLAFGLGTALLGLFAVIQRNKGQAAMLDLSLFKIRSFNGVAWGTFLNNAAALASIFLLISYMQNVLGYSAWETGLRFLPLTLTLFVVALATGRLGSAVAPGMLLGTAIALIAAGLALATLVRPSSDWTVLLPSLIVMGAGMGMFNPPRAAVTIGVVGPARAGMASGVGQTFQQAGVAIGVSGFGALFQSCVESAFTQSAVGRQLGDQADAVAHEVATGTLSDIGDLVPASMVETATAAARVAYVDSLTEVIRLCALAATIGAVLVFTLVRRSDLHESALVEAKS